MKKLFVITRSDLSLPNQAVQAGHAVADYMLNSEHLQDGWRNEILVYLVVANEQELSRLRLKLESKFIEHYDFFEPDLDNQFTAMAVCGYDNNFTDLKLMGT